METLNTHVNLHSLNLSNVCHKCVNNTQILLSELYIKVTDISKNIYYLLRSVWPRALLSDLDPHIFLR